MRRALLTIALIGTPGLSVANSTMVAKMPGQTTMQIIANAVTCNGGAVAIYMGPDGKNIDKTCNVKIRRDVITIEFAGYGKPLRMPRAQFSTVAIDSSADSAPAANKVDLTEPQKNAARSAIQYLQISGFSRGGSFGNSPHLPERVTKFLMPLLLWIA